MKKLEAHSEQEESIGFKQVIATIQDLLHVSEEDILRLFRVTIKCQETGKWTVRQEAGQKELLISKDTGVSYRIGVQTIRQWNKATQNMEAREIPILINREHQPKVPNIIPGGLRGFGPDFFDAEQEDR